MQTQLLPQKVAKRLWLLATLILGWGLGYGPPARADSPLTSTDLASAYDDVPAVQMAKRWQQLDPYIVNFLLGDRPRDEKAAVINAIGWQYGGTQRAQELLTAIAKRQGKSRSQLTLADLTPDQQFVVGYLLALDDYMYLQPLTPQAQDPLGRSTALHLLSRAAYALPEDFTVQFVRSLVTAQSWFGNSWCALYLEPLAVLRQFPPPERNLRPGAVQAAMEYLDLYQGYCGAEDL